LRSYASEALEFVRVQATGLTWDVSNVAGTGAFQELVLSRLPANDPRLVYASLLLLVRGGAGENFALSARGPLSGSADGIAYTTGSSARGGAGGPFMVRVGGAENRSIWWNAAAGANCYITVLGYWRRVG
jgi:hypothetical protein